jgi:hypothetical protein
MRRSIAVFSAALVLAACDGGGGGGGNPPPPATTGAIRVDNGTSYTIHEMYVVPNTAGNWGAQQNSSPIPSGGSWTLADVPAGLWDVRAVSIGASSTYFAYAHDATVAAAQTTVLTPLNGHFTGSLKVTNGSVYAITALYVVQSPSTTWGSNWLSSPMPTGYTFHLYSMPPGAFDVQCVYSSGGTSQGTYSITSFSVMNVTCS